jgi:predicted kinase
MKTTLVSGPPCSGKTTYIAERVRPGDVVVSYDAIADALSAEGTSRKAVRPFVLSAFFAVLQEQRRARLRGFRGDVWIEQCAPRAEQRNRFVVLNGADVVVLETDAETCHVRALERYGPGKRLTEYIDEIDKWWRIFERERECPQRTIGSTVARKSGLPARRRVGSPR